MPDIFEPIRWKIWRAKFYAKDLQARSEKFAKSKFCDITPKMDRQKRIVAYIKRVDALPYDYSILAGEAFQQLRSALDHLVFLFAKPRTEREEQSVEFPIVSGRKSFYGTISKGKRNGGV